MYDIQCSCDASHIVAIVTEILLGSQYLLSSYNACSTIRFENSHITLETKVRDGCKNETKYKDYHQSCFPVKQVKAHQVNLIRGVFYEHALCVRVQTDIVYFTTVTVTRTRIQSREDDTAETIAQVLMIRLRF